MIHSAFEVKSFRLNAVSIRLQQADCAALAQQLQQTADKYRMFAGMPVVLDLQQFQSPEQIDLAEILKLFEQNGLSIRALVHSEQQWAHTAAAYHLAFQSIRKSNDQTGDAGPADLPAPNGTIQAASADVEQTVSAQKNPTVVVSGPVRSGQQVYAENADLIVLGMVSKGAEIIADGHIHVYAPLRGRAVAGASGDRSARIFVQSMQAELVSVAGIFRLFDQDLPPHLQHRAVQVSLQDNRLAVSAIHAE